MRTWPDSRAEYAGTGEEHSVGDAGGRRGLELRGDHLHLPRQMGLTEPSTDWQVASMTTYSRPLMFGAVAQSVDEERDHALAVRDSFVRHGQALREVPVQRSDSHPSQIGDFLRGCVHA
ncbi:MAG: hypothetical protein JWR32_4200 [Mycobacterium sp.]|jgi:hypothetical protein|nr:hypothetical protein [Mycobacterium sp.]